MKIRIGTKLITSFMLVVLLMVALALYLLNVSQKSLQQSVGKSSLLLAEEMLKRIDRDVYLKIEAVPKLSKQVLVQKRLQNQTRNLSSWRGLKSIYILRTQNGFLHQKMKSLWSCKDCSITNCQPA